MHEAADALELLSMGSSQHEPLGDASWQGPEHLWSEPNRSLSSTLFLNCRALPHRGGAAVAYPPGLAQDLEAAAASG